jgi:hypothetical protein
MRDPSGHIVHYNPGEPPEFDEPDYEAENERLRIALAGALLYMEDRLYKDAKLVIKKALAEANRGDA